MKRCSTCNKTFTDEKLSYCVDDGTPLVEVLDDEDELTQVGTGTNWNPPAYQPPSYVPPGGQTQRRTWPGLAAVVGLLVIMLVGFIIAAVVYVPRLMKKADQTAESKEKSNNSNSNSSDHTDPKNTNANAAVDAPPPTDKELVLTQLKDLENEWTVANINADKKKLAMILADDFVGQVGNGRIQGKSEYINTIPRDTTTQKWEFLDLRLTLQGDRATLLGKVHFTLTDREEVYDFVDRFVWRDGRWQATGSEVTLNQQ